MIKELWIGGLLVMYKRHDKVKVVISFSNISTEKSVVYLETDSGRTPECE